MHSVNSVISVFCKGFLTIALLLGVFLLDTGTSAAQTEIEEKTLISVENFRVQKRNLPWGGTTVQVYGWAPSGSDGTPFRYGGVVYRVRAVHDGYFYGRKNVVAVISPPFPPEDLPDGVERGDFTLETGDPGSSERNSFKFSAASSQDSENRWAGSAGWSWLQSLANNYFSKGTFRITVADKSVADNLRFAEFRPKPDENSGRLEFVRELENNEEKLFRVCDKGDNEFGKEEARVACRQLGIETSNAEPIDLSTTDWLTSSTPGDLGTLTDLAEVLSIYGSPALLDNIQCEGDEKRLIDCNHLGFGVVSGGNCPVNNTVAVDCSATSSTDNSNSGSDSTDSSNSDSDNNGCICGQAPNGQCWSSRHCGQGEV